MTDLSRPRAAPGQEETFDVVVVGSGGAGLTAAVTAAAKGLQVVVLEKAPVFGGTTAISGGGLWIPCNAAAARQGKPDSRDAARTYFQHATGNRFDVRRIDAFLDHAPAMVTFLEAQTEVQFSASIDRPDYYPSAPGASDGGRTIFPLPFDGRRLGDDMRRLRPPAKQLTFMGIMIRPGPELQHFINVFRSFTSAGIVARRIARHLRDLLLHGRSMDLSNGSALVARLARSAFNFGASIRTSVSVRELIVTNGRVDGVEVVVEGRAHRIIARRGVILACGGFPHDVERRRELYPHAPTGLEHASPAPDTNTGDGLRMAERVGAVVDADISDAAAWAPVSIVPDGQGGSMVFPHLIDRQKPGFIAVTRRGKRFVNESGSYHEFVRGLISACENDGEAFAYLIADHRTIRRYGIGIAKPAPVPIGGYLRSGYLLRGATVRELAERAGIDVTAFQATIEAFNRHARVGEDPEFGRGSTSYNRYNGDQTHRPNPCIAPIEHGPFYAVRIVAGELGTFAGLKTDERARVLTGDGRLIPGLYAAGNDMAHIMAGEYMGGGATLGPGCTFGYIAACDLADPQGAEAAPLPS